MRAQAHPVLLFFSLGILANVDNVALRENEQVARIVRVQVERNHETLCLVHNQIFYILRTVPYKAQYAALGSFAFEICYFVEIEQIFHVHI
jgi:hypothetical protein